MLKLLAKDTCDLCNGTGEASKKLQRVGAPVKPCEACNGTGDVSHWVTVQEAFDLAFKLAVMRDMKTPGNTEGEKRKI